MAAAAVEFSIRFPPAQGPDELARSTRLAEDAGFQAIWMVDTP
ncbi:MAG TPA: hypothetical protein VHA53_01660 [Nitrolancea sp.]|nr:hypothetical protein [Nitrolancea sp.]